MLPGYFHIFRQFLKIGATAFGSATSEVLIEELVEGRRWLTMEQFQSGIALAGLSPGPFHLNLVMNLGYQLRGFRGMGLSVIGFILPSFLLVLGIAYSLTTDSVSSFLQNHPGVIAGLVAGTAGLLATAIRKLWVRSAPSFTSSFVVIILAALVFWLDIPFIVVILLSGVMGVAVFYVYHRFLQ